MHNNYYFLRQLSAALRPRLHTLSLHEAFSQNKNELILGFANASTEFYIKAYLDPSFCCLSFPENFSRARKNSVDLFSTLLHKNVLELCQFENERCFSIIFEDETELLFKMHGNRSNIILFSKGEVIEVFKKSLKKDFDIKLASLNRPIDQSHESFIQHDGNERELFPTFGKLIKKHLHTLHFQEKSIEEKWKVIQQTLQKLEQPTYYITEIEEQLHLSLLDIGEVKHRFDSPIQAANSFFMQYITNTALRSLKKELLTDINKQLKKSENYIKKTEQKLAAIETQQNYSQVADIIMANLHRIPSQVSEMTLENFYDNNSPINIKLKAGLSPQKNAETYYRKAKNQSMEVENLITNLTQKEDVVQRLREEKYRVENTSDLKSLRGLVKKERVQQSNRKKQQSRPFHTFHLRGFDIWVGKSAKSNDLMLQQYAFKDDLWLHAKDVSGSHVLIKYQAGKKIPKDIIEKAAEMAAYYSKRKSDSLCPVIVTPRKFVRKRKGDPAGAVVVDKEEQTVLVRPNHWA